MQAAPWKGCMLHYNMRLLDVCCCCNFDKTRHVNREIRYLCVQHIHHREMVAITYLGLFPSPFSAVAFVASCWAINVFLDNITFTKCECVWWWWGIWSKTPLFPECCLSRIVCRIQAIYNSFLQTDSSSLSEWKGPALSLTSRFAGCLRKIVLLQKRSDERGNGNIHVTIITFLMSFL